MTIIKGDLLEITEGIICHQVNCQRVAGAGLALQIRNKWPEWYSQFKVEEPGLGKIWLWETPTRGLFVVSLYAQDRYGRGSQTDYKALERCLTSLDFRVWYCKPYSSYHRYKIYFPFGLGAGLGGGDWKIIETLIEKYFPDATLVEKD